MKDRVIIDTSSSDWGASDQKPVDWIEGQEFSFCEDIFPDWDNVRNILTVYIGSLGDWFVAVYPDEIRVGLEWENNIDVPEEKKGDFYEIWSGTLSDYMPDTAKFEGKQVGKDLPNLIMSEIEKREKHILLCGGRPLKDELLFRFGVKP